MQKIILLTLLLLAASLAKAQQIPNGDFKKWDEYGCPEDWGCNNDADCKGKVTKADKLKGGVKLTVMHCVDINKEDRSNGVTINYDNLSASILRHKKVKIAFDYSYTPVGGDVAYVKIDVDLEEAQDAKGNTIIGLFEYNGNQDGILKPGTNQHVDSYINFDPTGKMYNAPDDLNANSIRTTFGIMAAPGTKDEHKGSTLIINHVKFSIE